MTPKMTHIVQSSVALPIGSCRRRRRRSAIDERGIDQPNGVIPWTCRYMLIGRSSTVDATTNKETNEQEDRRISHNNNNSSSSAVTPPQPESSPTPVWYLCRILVAAHAMIDDDDDDNTNDADTHELSVQDNDETLALEYFECALNIALIGYDPTLPTTTTTNRIETFQGKNGNHHTTTKIAVVVPVTEILTSSKIPPTIHVRPTPTTTTTTTTTRCVAVINDETRCTSFLLPLQHRQTIPILSVFMTYHGYLLSSFSSSSSSSSSSASPTELSNQPLLQSCLKRQLVGCHVCLWNLGGVNKKIGGIVKTTRVQFSFDHTMWTFFVDSVTAATTTQSSSTSTTTATDTVGVDFDIGVILPSTRITFLHPISTTAVPTLLQPLSSSVSSSTNSSFYQSPAVRMLLDTIHCINRIQHMSSSPAFPILGDVPRAFLLSGPPGVGKTHAIRTVVDIIASNSAVAGNDEFGLPFCQLVTLQGSEILSMGQQYSDAAKVLEGYFLNSIQQMRNNTDITIMFLDECDALISSHTDDSNSLIIESTLGRLLDKMNNVSIISGGDPTYLRLIVVAATNRVDAIPSSLRRPGRFDREIPMAPPNVTTRLQILESLLASQETSKTIHIEDHRPSQTELRDIADLCVGFVPADLAAVVRKVELFRIVEVQETFDGNSDETTNTRVTKSQIDLWTRAISEVGASALRDAALTAPPTTTWDDIAGDPGGAKTTLRQAVEWPRTKRAAYERLGLIPPRGILLHGPPGCAKTTLARAAAGASAVSFLSLSPADVYSTSFVGDAEAVIRRAFTLARSASPCVLFFDEIDAILGMDENHSSHQNGMGRGSAVEARVLSTFLNEMDGVDGSWKDGVLVLGATNRPWTLDTALLRPGRFDKVIYVPPPDFDGRREIISMHCRHWSKHMAVGSMFDIDYLASDVISGNMTGAEIVGACREAAMLCFREATATNTSDASTVSTCATPLIMKQEYLETALTNVRPLLANISIMEDFQSFQMERMRQIDP